MSIARCTRTATSPACVPTRRYFVESAINAARSQAQRQLLPATVRAPDAAAVHPQRSRTRRKRTRPSGPPVTCSGAGPAACSSAPTSSGSELILATHRGLTDGRCARYDNCRCGSQALRRAVSRLSSTRRSRHRSRASSTAYVPGIRRAGPAASPTTPSHLPKPDARGSGSTPPSYHNELNICHGSPGVADQGARRLEHRPAVDVQL